MDLIRIEPLKLRYVFSYALSRNIYVSKFGRIFNFNRNLSKQNPFFHTL